MWNGTNDGAKEKETSEEGKELAKIRREGIQQEIEESTWRRENAEGEIGRMELLEGGREIRTNRLTDMEREREADHFLSHFA